MTLTSSAPIGPLGGGPEGRTAFDAYLACFNGGDVEGFTAYYTDDVIFDLGVAAPLLGKAAVQGMYHALFATLRETVTIDAMTATDALISAEISVLFSALADTPQFPLGPLKAGETMTARFDIRYVLSGGLAKEVRLTPPGRRPPP